MRKSLIATLMVVNFTIPVLAAETFYVILDKTLKGCTVVTTEPLDKVRYKVLGTYKSEAKLGTLCRHSRNVKRPLEERFVANVTCGESYPAISPLWLGSRGHMGPPLAGAFLAPRRC